MNFDIIFMQVQIVAEFGVIFHLFALGLEFSSTKVCIVRVAVLGGEEYLRPPSS